VRRTMNMLDVRAQLLIAVILVSAAGAVSAQTGQTEGQAASPAVPAATSAPAAKEAAVPKFDAAKKADMQKQQPAEIGDRAAVPVTPVQPETATAKTDTVKTDTVKTDAAKADPVKADAVKADTAKADTVKTDTARKADARKLLPRVEVADQAGPTAAPESADAAVARADVSRKPEVKQAQHAASSGWRCGWGLLSWGHCSGSGRGPGLVLGTTY
jgi:hypothetical protein